MELVELQRLEVLARLCSNPFARKYLDGEAIKEYFNLYGVDMSPMNNVVFCKDDPVVDNVVKKFLTRSADGMIKYKTSMKDNKAPTLEWINHAQEEAMDFILYLERLKEDVRNMRNMLNSGSDWS